MAGRPRQGSSPAQEPARGQTRKGECRIANDLITTPFGADSTAADVIAGVDLFGRRAIVTGASSGIGLETARALAAAGAEVTLAVRNKAAGERAATDIASTITSGSVLVSELDVSDRNSVADFVAKWRGTLNILVNNAGIMATPEMRTAEGWELQFATNHLGHFALANGLHDFLGVGRSSPDRRRQLGRTSQWRRVVRRHRL